VRGLFAFGTVAIEVSLLAFSINRPLHGAYRSISLRIDILFFSPKSPSTGRPFKKVAAVVRMHVSSRK